MKKCISIVSIIICFSCLNKSRKSFDELEKMKWLIGEWENKMPDGNLTETWTKQNDSVYSGTSYFIKGKDTLHSESIELYQVEDQLIYSATVKGQNNNDAVDFKLNSETENVFSFENPKHDYPQKIVYKKVSETSLLATISGKQHGKMSSESYPMRRK